MPPKHSAIRFRPTYYSTSRTFEITSISETGAEMLANGISRFPRPFILPLLHTHLASPSSALRISMRGAAVAERLARSPPTKANRARSPAASPDFRKWESCRMMPLVGGPSRRSAVPPPHLHSGAAPYSLQSPSSALETSHWVPLDNLTLRLPEGGNITDDRREDADCTNFRTAFLNCDYWAAISWRGGGMQQSGKQENSEETPTFPTCEIPGMTASGIECGSLMCEGENLTIRPSSSISSWAKHVFENLCFSTRLMSRLGFESLVRNSSC
ncbi:hypothetical protein PR048_017840 [Dryococelus australis]|uniref:Uncharacterized protein n=1 Tax=Dryococelus australis TaxID=614101 RepID=A0ABQ9HAR1_9NEOP|nr:hypothetical protein PR048_017840 [Dryococelus australis]